MNTGLVLLLAYLPGFIASMILISEYLKQSHGIDTWTRWIMTFEASVLWPIVALALLGIYTTGIIIEMIDWLQVKIWILKRKIGKYLRKSTPS